MISKDNFQPSFGERRFKTLPGGVVKRDSGRRGGRHAEDRDDTTASIAKQLGMRRRLDRKQVVEDFEGE